MRYIMVLALAFLVGCNEQESSPKESSDYVASQKAKIDKILQQDSNTSSEAKLLMPTAISGNSLYSQSLEELRKVYANPKGQSCITLSENLQGKKPDSGYNKPDLELLQQSCKGYSTKTPYSFAEIIDPKAIGQFREKSLRATCDEQEKSVDGRFIKRAKACEKFFASAKK